MVERLRYVADNLNRIYAPEPMVEADDFQALIDQLRAGERRGLPNVRQLCAGVASNEERVVICPVCGQMFDCRDQAQVHHHSSGEHAPKLVIRPS